MATLILIPWAETTWKAANRLAGRTPLPLTDAGCDEVRTWSERIVELRPAIVFCSEERASLETAEIIAEKTGASRKKLADLAEVDMGLWDGLTSDELKRRYPKIYKKWQQDPSSVSPPEGEALSDASERLRVALERIMRKYDDRCVAVILGPLSLALVRCWIESIDVDKLRSLAGDAPIRYELAAANAGNGGVSPCELSADPEVPLAVERDG